MQWPQASYPHEDTHEQRVRFGCGLLPPLCTWLQTEKVTGLQGVLWGKRARGGGLGGWPRVAQGLGVSAQVGLIWSSSLPHHVLLGKRFSFSEPSYQWLLWDPTCFMGSLSALLDKWGNVQAVLSTLNRLLFQCLLVIQKSWYLKSPMRHTSQNPPYC